MAIENRLKFRVWNDIKKKYENDFDFAISGNGALYASIDDRWYWASLNRNPEISIEQCTGIRDKTGTLIYEGDVVTLYPIETKYHRQRVVTWLHDHWTTVRKNTTGANIYWTFGHHEIKVIGNIHTMSDKSVPSDRSVQSEEASK